MTLPYEIKERFYKVIKGDITLVDFEQWLYSDKELETCLDSEDYINLISLDFKKSSTKHDLYNFLKKHTDIGEFEAYKMLELLKEAQQKNDKLPYLLMEFYDLYCSGYDFLQDIGLGMGLDIRVPNIKNSTADTWEELTIEQQNKLLNSFSPELEKCIEKAIYWLETKKIILTGEKNEIGKYTYKDLRTKKEKKSKLWIPFSEGKIKGFKNKLWEKLW